MPFMGTSLEIRLIVAWLRMPTHAVAARTLPGGMCEARSSNDGGTAFRFRTAFTRLLFPEPS